MNQNISIQSFSSFQTFHANTYKEDLALLHELSRDQLNHCHEILETYANCRDLTLLTHEEIESILSLLYRLAVAQRLERNNDKAHKYLLEGEDIYSLLGIKDTLEVAQNNYGLASIYLDRNDLVKAEKYLKEVNRICELLDSDPDVTNLQIQNLGMLATVQAKRNEVDEALEIFNSILERVHEVHESDLPTFLLSTYRDMGYIYAFKKDQDKVMEYWTKGLNVAINHFGEEAAVADFFYNNLAKSLHDSGRSEEALPYAKKGLKVALKNYTKDSVEVAWNQNLIGHIYLATGDLLRGIESYKKAIKTYEKQEQDFSNELGDAYIGIARVQYFSENLQDAIEAFNKGSKFITMANGENHLSIAELYFEWANLLKEHEETMFESQTYFRKALEIYKVLEPVNKLAVADINGFLGELAFYEGDLKRSLELWKECEKYFDECSTDPARLEIIQSFLGGLHLRLQNYDESLKHFQRTVDACEANAESNKESLGTHYWNLGRAYEEKGNLNEALEAYQKGLKADEECFGQEHPNTEASAVRVLELMDKIKGSGDGSGVRMVYEGDDVGIKTKE